MKKQLLTLALLSVGLSQAQIIWQEDFSTATPPGLPAGWTQNNVDGKTPANNSVINGFNFGTNAGVTRNISTAFGYPASFGISLITMSSYNPTGPSDDWVITPSINLLPNAVLKWQARSADQSLREVYEIRISTAGTAVSDFLANPPLFSTGAAGELYVAGSFTSRGVSLNTYSNQTVYLAVHDISNNRWTGYYDNFMVLVPAVSDGEIVSINGLPRYKAGAGPQNISATFRQMGYTPAGNAVVHYNVNNGAVTTETVNFTPNVQYNNSSNFNFSTPANLALGTNKIKVWVTEVNGTPETPNAADTAYATVYVASTTKPRKALIEEWSSSTCAPCAALNVNFDPLLNNNNPNEGGDVNVIKYQVNWPAPGNDPSYNNHSFARRLHYEINAAPSAYANGRTDMVSHSQAEINTAKNEPAFAEITATLSASKTGTSLATATTAIKATATVVPYVDIPANSPVRVFQALLERHYTYNSGTTSQKQYYHVMRTMDAGGWGTPVALGDGTSFTVALNHSPKYSPVDPTPAQFSYSFWTTPSSIVYEYVVFLQDTVSNHILQSGSWSDTMIVDIKAPPTNTTGISEVSAIGKMSVYPNPANDFAMVGVDLVNGSKVEMTITDIAGRVIYTSEPADLPAGHHDMAISTAELAQGTYFISVSSSDGSKSQEKLIIHR